MANLQSAHLYPRYRTSLTKPNYHTANSIYTNKIPSFFYCTSANQRSGFLNPMQNKIIHCLLLSSLSLLYYWESSFSGLELCASYHCSPTAPNAHYAHFLVLHFLNTFMHSYAAYQCCLHSTTALLWEMLLFCFRDACLHQLASYSSQHASQCLLNMSFVYVLCITQNVRGTLDSTCSLNNSSSPYNLFSLSWQLPIIWKAHFTWIFYPVIYSSFLRSQCMEPREHKGQHYESTGKAQLTDS